ncbi:hypothetical protein [Streptacidiphilus jiangxiensis]|uniref:Uncharacterized protein n=1 Tax=Streptacidiphilus jiangxiensis TaxID=235985 RepID=A0A1H7LAX1_STRJI|nr:hypothetical protein [Streptacidiphilus jiangxiensis]SEK96028.1 hypothetical protein SAMN05414137_104430 [Streptacidiphilus jiangxiensis]
MSVILCLLVAPLGLFLILGLSWFEDHVLRPPASPAEQALQKAVELLNKPRG